MRGVRGGGVYFPVIRQLYESGMTVIIDIAQAAEELEALVDRVAAGEEIWIAVEGKAVVAMRGVDHETEKTEGTFANE